MPLGAGSAMKKVDRRMAVKIVLNRGALSSDKGSQKGFLEKMISSSLNSFNLGGEWWEV